MNLVRLFHQLGPAYIRWTAANIPTDGLSPARMGLLRLLIERGALSMRELKEATGSTAANITKLIDGLEASALVERLPDPSDRRVTRVRATSAGRRQAKEQWEAYERATARVFARMSRRNRAALAQAAGELNSILQEMA